MNYELTQHARKVLEERATAIACIERTLENPEETTPDPGDAAIQRFYRAIPEFGGRTLRVAVNTTTSPWRVVSVFFDRNKRVPIGELPDREASHGRRAASGARTTSQ